MVANEDRQANVIIVTTFCFQSFWVWSMWFQGPSCLLHVELVVLISIDSFTLLLLQRCCFSKVLVRSTRAHAREGIDSHCAARSDVLNCRKAYQVLAAAFAVLECEYLPSACHAVCRHLLVVFRSKQLARCLAPILAASQCATR